MGTQPPDGHVPLIMQTSHPLGVSWWEGNQNRASKVQCKTLLSQSTGAKEVIDGTHSEGMEHLSFPKVPLPAQDSLSHHSRMAKSLCCGVRESGFKSCLHPLLAVWLWLNYLTSPCFNFLTFKTARFNTTFLKGWFRRVNEKMHRRLQTQSRVHREHSATSAQASPSSVVKQSQESAKERLVSSFKHLIYGPASCLATAPSGSSGQGKRVIVLSLV